jgi:murein L,D-transpeptidase YcbB/YkuD
VPAAERPEPLATPLASPRLEGDIVANMERWRWLPATVAPRYLLVNIPEFKLRLFENGQVAHETRVITGRPETPTPILSSLMDHAVVNPSWYIPPSIMKKEILPGLAADPGYAERRGYQVIRRGGQISVRQPPGERNALGFIKFMFPNGHAVYLHDTPNRSLFSASRRALSHGCVRVEQPFQLADFVLGAEWSESRLKKLIGRGERTIRLPAPMPVHLAYFTIEVDAFGSIRTFEDLYGYNRRVRAALGFGA